MIRRWAIVALLLLPACTKKPAEPVAAPATATGSPTAPASASAAATPPAGSAASSPVVASTPDPAVEAAETAALDALDALAHKGKAMYLAYCSACHNSNPRQAGTLGPDVYGSSLALLEARILKAEYPAGYEPKRKSKAMVALPQVKADISAIHAFLNAP